MIQVPENEVMNQTDLSSSVLHEQTTGFTTVISKVSIYFGKQYENVCPSPRMLLYPERISAYWYPSFVSLNVIEGMFGHVVSSFWGITLTISHLLGM